MKIERLLEMIYYLLNKKNVTAKELAERFNVSKRTIYRDIDTLSLSGIPIYAAKGNNGGIRILDNFVLNKSVFSEREQKEILSALHVLLTVKTEDTGFTLRKMEAFFNLNAPDWFEVDFTRWGPDSNESYTSIKTAILEKLILEFEYYSTYGEKTCRRVEPIKLWFKSRYWYLKCYCLEKNSLRLFKLTRMRNITVTEEKFCERDYAKECAAQTESTKNEPPNNKQKEITVIMKIAPEMTYRVYDDFDDSQIIKNDDGSFIVTMKEFEDNRLYGYILSYGEHAVVLEPEYAKQIIKEKSKKIFDSYF